MENKVNLNLLISKVKCLSQKEKYHILNIFKKHEVKYTKNTNGYFFNLEKVDLHIIQKVIKCIDLIENEREIISEMDKKRELHLEYYKSLIDSKLKERILLQNNQYINTLILNNSSEIIIKKKCETKKCNNFNTDPDILIKEYVSSKKYNKKHIFYKITQTMRTKRPKNTKISINNYSIGNIEDENEREDEQENEQEEFECNEDNEVEQKTSEIDADRETSFDNDDIRVESDDSDNEIEEDINVYDFEYYKDILKKKGYLFNEDKNVIMAKEKYIE